MPSHTPGAASSAALHRAGRRLLLAGSARSCQQAVVPNGCPRKWGQRIGALNARHRSPERETPGFQLFQPCGSLVGLQPEVTSQIL
jgi:hypothetical protein